MFDWKLVPVICKHNLTRLGESWYKANNGLFEFRPAFVCVLRALKVLKVPFHGLCLQRLKRIQNIFAAHACFVWPCLFTSDWVLVWANQKFTTLWNANRLLIESLLCLAWGCNESVTTDAWCNVTDGSDQSRNFAFDCFWSSVTEFTVPGHCLHIRACQRSSLLNRCPILLWNGVWINQLCLWQSRAPRLLTPPAI